MTDRDRVIAWLWFLIVCVFVAVFIALVVSGCTSVPKAESPPPVENERHVIRYLAVSAEIISDNRPAVWLIEVDGQQFVGIERCGVYKKEAGNGSGAAQADH